MSKAEKEPSEVLADFLNYIDRARYEHKEAQDAVKKEDKRLQDLLHELEFAQDKAERNRVATKFQRSRRGRCRGMNAAEKIDLLKVLLNNYVALQATKTWKRENANSYSVAKGKLGRTCREFEIDIKENDMGIWLFSRKGRYITHISKGGVEE